MKNLGCLSPYSSQNVTESAASRKTFFFWPKKEFKNMLAYFLGFNTYCFHVII